MAKIKRRFPKFEEITSREIVEVYLDNIFQYTIDTKSQFTNIRLWAKRNKAEKRLLFKWKGGEVTLEGDRLRGNVTGFLSADVDSWYSFEFQDMPTEYFI